MPARRVAVWGRARSLESARGLIERVCTDLAARFRRKAHGFMMGERFKWHWTFSTVTMVQVIDESQAPEWVDQAYEPVQEQ